MYSWKDFCDELYYISRLTIIICAASPSEDNIVVHVGVAWIRTTFSEWNRILDTGNKYENKWVQMKGPWLV